MRLAPAPGQGDAVAPPPDLNDPAGPGFSTCDAFAVFAATAAQYPDQPAIIDPETCLT